jgi:hypothetical protein
MTGTGIRWAVVSWIALGGLWAGGGTAHSAQAAPQGQVTWAIHFTAAPTYFEPAEHQGIITPMMFYYALHDALVKPMPGNIMPPAWRSRGPRARMGWSMSSDYARGCASIMATP